jgi:hypothetical protein
MSENKNANKQQDNDPNSWKNRERGAIWAYPDKLSIFIKDSNGKELKYVAFKNKFKSEEKHPEWRVYTEIPRDSVTPAKSAPKPEKSAKSVKVQKEEETDSGDF